MIKTRLKIRTYDDPCLRKKSSPVQSVGAAEIMLIQAMIDTISQKENEIGLAAPQIGINKQIFVIDLGDGPAVFINPKILKKQGKEVMEEGCLSFPGLSFTIERAKRIVVDYINVDNEPCRLECEDFLARVILHEHDHLHGKMIIDYGSKKEKEEQKEIIDNLVEKTRQDLKSNS